MKVVIRAGGVGSRLWPVSREKNPKQFHALTSERTMLEEAIDRVLPVAAHGDIFLSVNADAEQLVREQHHEIMDENIIVEPERKDTAAAIGLESITIRRQDPEAIVASLGSDHSVKRPTEFQKVLRLAAGFVERHPDTIIPIGIRPTHPDVGYGYIKLGEVIDSAEGKNLWKVDRFTEKPSLKEAKQFLSEANYLWNGNMFVWKVSTILALYEKFLPEMYEKLLIIEKALGMPQQRETIARVYPELEKIAVDYAIIEKTDKIAAMAADIGWSDIGDWARLKDELAESEEANVVINAEHIGVDTENTLVYSGKKGKVIATIGLQNLVVVETEDAILICDKYRSDSVRMVVEKLKERKRSDVL
jgi:mannose-1-phosphate guanylyltransferase